MLVLSFDLEATGLEVQYARIIELGAVIWDAKKKSPVYLMNMLVKDDPEMKLSDEIINLTGIDQESLDTYGGKLAEALEALNSMVKTFKPELVLAHNGKIYDAPLLREEYKRSGVTPALSGLPLIDTREDIPYPSSLRNRDLISLCANHGFLNYFPHRAVFDALMTAKLFSCYDPDEVVAYSKIPWLVVRAIVSYDHRELAKSQRYMWEKIGDRTFPKQWVKRIKQTELEQETAKAGATGFRIQVIQGD